MFFDQSFVIYHDTGKTEIVDDLYEYIRLKDGIRNFHSRMKFNLGPYTKADYSYYMYNFTSYWYSSMESTNHVGFFLCTSNGMMISPDLLLSEYNNKYNCLYGKRRGHRFWHKSYKRHTNRRDKRPHNQQARRVAAGVVKEEGEPEFRGPRKYKYLRTYWDDINVRGSCSWKNCTKRKRQYKGS